MSVSVALALTGLLLWFVAGIALLMAKLVDSDRTEELMNWISGVIFVVGTLSYLAAIWTSVARG